MIEEWHNARRVAKQGIPPRINPRADKDAGSGREIVFPDFGVGKIVPAGGAETVEFNLPRKGEFGFRCSMDMVHSPLIVE